MQTLPTPASPKPSVAGALPRYGAVGASGVLVNLAVVYLLHGLGEVWFPLASALATESAIVWNYLGNELWTFHHRRLAWARLAKFNASALAGLAATVTVASLAALTLHPLLAQLVGIAAGAAVNFSLNFGWTWRR